MSEILKSESLRREVEGLLRPVEWSPFIRLLIYHTTRCHFPENYYLDIRRMKITNSLADVKNTGELDNWKSLHFEALIVIFIRNLYVTMFNFILIVVYIYVYIYIY